MGWQKRDGLCNFLRDSQKKNKRSPSAWVGKGNASSEESSCNSGRDKRPDGFAAQRPQQGAVVP